MKTVITGSRTAHRLQSLRDAIAVADMIGIVISSVVTGCGVGAEELALSWSETNDMPVQQVRGDYDKHGDDCWVKRGEEMVDMSAAVILLWHPADIQYLEHILQYATWKNLPILVWSI